MYLDFDFCLGSGGKHSGASVDQPSGTATELLAVLSKSPMPAASMSMSTPVDGDVFRKIDRI